MLKANQLKIEYSEILFSDVSFALGNKEKIGLVGLNGCGKSTLLKMIVDKVEPDSGSIEAGNEKIGYLPQEFEFKSDEYVGEYLESLVDDHISEMWKVEMILSKLGIKLVNDGKPDDPNPNLSELDFFSVVNSLSEGQKMKLYLTSLLVNDATVLLLDEPTNHLDIEGIEWFEKFVKKFDGICIIISHDRSFLNNTVDQIFEIDEKRLNIFHGNYDDYLVQKEDWIEKRALDYRLQERKRAQLEKLLVRARSIGDPNKRSTAVSSAKKRMEREVVSTEIGAYKKNTLHKIKIEGDVHKTKTILDVKNLSFGYGEDPIIENSNLSLFGQDIVWFRGGNGIGKTTVVKLINGILAPQKGMVKIGTNINWAYFSQDQSHLPLDFKMRDYIIEYGKIDYDKSFGVLEKFLFPKKMQEMKIKDLSPGQRARLSIAAFVQHEYEFLILDEPTNHLDIRTKEVIENALAKFGGTLLVISHDRYFIDNIGINRVITIKNKQLLEV